MLSLTSDLYLRSIIMELLKQEEICKSLKDYNSQIEQLKQEMDDATRGADNIRSDIGALAQRYTVIDREQDCGVRHR
jgi:vacuolar protein sorting-associated protein 18